MSASSRRSRLTSLALFLCSRLASLDFCFARSLSDRFARSISALVISPHSSSFFICQASSLLALICSRLAPTLCSIALGPRSSVFPCTLWPRFAVLVFGSCFCTRVVVPSLSVCIFVSARALRPRFAVIVFGSCLRCCFVGACRVTLFLGFFFAACLRCLVCHLPSLLGLLRAFVSSRRVPLFSALAFVLGFGLRSRLRPSFIFCLCVEFWDCYNSFDPVLVLVLHTCFDGEILLQYLHRTGFVAGEIIGRNMILKL